MLTAVDRMRVATWPAITERLLRERQAMTNEEFLVYLGERLQARGPRALPDDPYGRAVGYPWGRPRGSCGVTGGDVRNLADGDAARAVLEPYLDDPERVPLL